MSPRLAAFRAFAETAGDAGLIVVKVETAEGSTPREAGAFMAVSQDAFFGTIGGGRLEMEAIARARALLKGEATETNMTLPLGPEIGQCCGGRVALSFRHHRSDLAAVERLVADEAARDPQVWIFGGGHVGRALVATLSLLPVQPHLVETRSDELALAPEGAERHLVAMPESLVPAIAPGGAVIVLTHDHALDFLIVEAALARPDLAYVGMIGSKTKRATFASQYRRAGHDAAGLARLTCPIGSKIEDKRPEVIAVTVAAELMALLSAPG
ncbi:xanthine dehydrogenase accessory protein XdhC [Pseudohoeflea coraliihabitans]|uniref:Xanthine dehydrogenase accessory protein XdhC n=1 Tax=Pseudohoeflea coraliihabitans TaxID=2860393 RepID=A0ABS6WM10_9HYPH|nr:xanthine dehydrogenase accessory protein XdhC [Pseudohoeflea sp. DP4N28-3]MBW3096996.1 xanthine dehydrogenase accessory protein XdhC [Pseudohoeflea sp. DP4N28-3]